MYSHFFKRTSRRKWIPKKCSKFHSEIVIHSINFERDETYQVDLQIWKHPCVSLKINSAIYKILKNIDIKSAAYKWKKKEMKYNITLKKDYKLYLSKSKFSLNLAFKHCNLLGMSLPNFKSQKHLEEVVSFLLAEYKLIAQALSIGLTYSVSFKSFKVLVGT